MTEVTVSVDIDRPAAEVFDYLVDMENNPKWQNGMRACTWTSEPPLGLGSTYDQEARFLGKALTSSFEVVEFEPGRRVRIKTTSGSMPIDVTREVASRTERACHVTAIVRGDPSGIFRIAAPLMDLMVKASVRRDYARLKKLLEP